jgi:hypothetical protein
MPGRFQLEPTTAVLEFAEGHRLHGLEVEVSLDTPIRLYQRIVALSVRNEGEDAEAVSKILDEFTDTVVQFGDNVLVEWNLDDAKGEPVPATGESLAAQPAHVVRSIMDEWLVAVVSPPVPLGDESPSGEQSDLVPFGRTEAS